MSDRLNYSKGSDPERLETQFFGLSTFVYLEKPWEQPPLNALAFDIPMMFTRMSNSFHRPSATDSHVDYLRDCKSVW
jgi:hypothetical protein